jgi:hypothetical protein
MTNLKIKLNEIISNKELTKEEKENKIKFLTKLAKLKKEIINFDKFTKEYVK